jgi:hypothetical protein
MRLSEPRFVGAVLRQAQFTGVEMYGPVFIRSDARQADFAHSWLHGPNFLWACLMSASFSHTRFDEADPTWGRANFSGAFGRNVDLTQTNLDVEHLNVPSRARRVVVWQQLMARTSYTPSWTMRRLALAGPFARRKRGVWRRGTSVRVSSTDRRGHRCDSCVLGCMFRLTRGRQSSPHQARR